MVYTYIFLPVLGLAINVIIQLLTCRYLVKFGVLKSVFTGFFSGIAIVITFDIIYFFLEKTASIEFLSQLTLSTITYAMLGYCYFHFVNLGETARRVRIARELWDSKTGLSMDELIKCYSTSNIINYRLQRLINNKQIVDRNGSYHIAKPTILWMAKLLVIMKLILLKKKSEYE
jgi:hypothetical protein